MFKLFKEVFKSFSKSKIILAGLTFLVFLNSGIVTLIFDVVKTLKSDYSTYKEKSNLHDLTMNSNIEPHGIKPSKMYDLSESSSWELIDEKEKQLNSIRINTNQNFYNIKNMLGQNASIDEYVSSKDLSYLLNSNLSNITIPDINNPTSKFLPNADSVNELTLYKYDAQNNKWEADINEITSIQNIKYWNKPFIGKGSWNDIKNVGDLINNQNEEITNVVSLIVDSNTKIAYIEEQLINKATKNDAVYKEYIENPSKFVRISNKQVAKWLGINSINIMCNCEKQDNNNENCKDCEIVYKYTMDLPNASDWIIDDIKPLTNISLNEFKTKKIKNNFLITTNEAFFNPIKVEKTKILKNEITIPNEWFVYSQPFYSFERKLYKLNGIYKNEIDEKNWSGIYLEYLKHIKNNNSELWNQIKNVSYWEKKLQNKLVDFNGNVVNDVQWNDDGTFIEIPQKTNELNIELLMSDLAKKLTNKNKPTEKKGIYEIENLSILSDDVAKSLNTNNTNKYEHLIENEAKNKGYKDFFEKFKRLIKETNNIGFRDTLTINSISQNEDNITYQFINMGDKNQEINWNGIKIRQNVDKLVNNGDLFNIKSSIDNQNKYIPQNLIPNIVLKLLSGMSLDRNYINPMISFESFTNIDSNNVNEIIQNAKIIWMVPNGANSFDSLIGITAIKTNFSNQFPDGKKYFILEKNNQSENANITTSWITHSKYSNFDNTSNSLIKIINDNKLTFAPFDYVGNTINLIPNDGWAKQNINYSDSFSIPFQYLLPRSDILEEYNKEKNFNIFKEHLIETLTETIKPLINTENWNSLVNAIVVGFANEGFGEALAPPAALSNYDIEKIFLGIFKFGATNSNQSFINNLMKNIFSSILEQIKKEPTIELQREFLKTELAKIEVFITMTTGAGFPNIISTIINQCDPIALFSSLIEIVESINLDKTFIELYDLIYLNKERQILRNQMLNLGYDYIVGSGDYLPILFGNITNVKKFKTSLISLMKSLNYLSPEIVNLLNVVTIENPSIAKSKLLEKTQLSKDINFKSYYNEIKLIDFLNSIGYVPVLGGIGSLINSITPLPDSIDIVYDRNFMNPLELDLDLVWYLENYLFADGRNKIFNVDVNKVLTEGINGIVEIKNDYSQISLSENASKVALVNEAFLEQNHKKVYKLNNYDDLNNLDKIDSKYKLNIANVEYLIIGTGLTADYMYPVLNSENIQVNTKNQALVYVNQDGYDRIRRSNENASRDRYFVIKKPNDISLIDTQTKLNQLVYSTMTGGTISDKLANSDSYNNYKKAFLKNENSLANPERAMRITTIDSLITKLEQIQLIVGVALIIITGIVISFVVKRYINSRAKVIGILKAQGYSSMEIALSICSFSLIISIFGGVFGYLVGHFSQLGVFKLLSIFWTIPIGVASFNWMTMLIAIIAPFILLSILIIIVTLWFLRKNSLSLINGSLDVNDKPSAKKIQNLIKNTNIKNKFSVSLSLSSIGKLFALFLSTVTTSTITLFAIVTYKVFNKSVDLTYKNKNYKFQTNLLTPTIESGEYFSIDINNTKVDDMLYVPIGIAEEGYTYKKDYFKPGKNEIINKPIDGDLYPNGDPKGNDPHIFTKSSIDLTVNAGGLTINVWENLINTIPESQRASIISISQDAAKWIKWTQEGNIIENKYITKFENYKEYSKEENDDNNEYLTLFNLETKENVKVNNEDIKINYFDYKINEQSPKDSHFVYKTIDSNNKKYSESKLIIDGTKVNNEIRKKYRDFLVLGYNKMFSFSNTKENELPFKPTKMPKYVLDYFISPSANIMGYDIENNNDETYTYIDITYKNSSQKIYGYDSNSNFIKIKDKKGNDLLKKIDEYSMSNEMVYPIIINEVFRQKHNLKINNIIEASVENGMLRFQEKLKNKIDNNINSNDKNIYKFQIIGISDTYINESIVTTKAIANKVLGMSKNGYNGIMSNSNSPTQITNSLSLYTTNGYWGADSVFNPESLNIKDQLNIYKELFYNVDKNNKNNSLLANNIRILYPNLIEEEVNNIIKKIIGVAQSESLELNETNGAKILESLNTFNDIYTNKILQGALVGAESNGIEKEYVSNISNTIWDGMTIILTISFAISITILIMITTMIINENERNIAIFGILGYTTKEKLRMFFSIYIPIVFVSILFSILLTWIFIPIFNSAILSISSIVLPISLSFAHIFLAGSIVALIFFITCLISWMLQSKIKPIMLLKEV